jgi:hypothetical protein
MKYSTNLNRFILMTIWTLFALKWLLSIWNLHSFVYLYNLEKWYSYHRFNISVLHCAVDLQFQFRLFSFKSTCLFSTIRYRFIYWCCKIVVWTISSSPNKMYRLFNDVVAFLYCIWIWKVVYHSYSGCSTYAVVLDFYPHFHFNQKTR